MTDPSFCHFAAGGARGFRGPTPRWQTWLVTAFLIVGFTIALTTIPDQRNDRHAEVCQLAESFLVEQKIAQAPAEVPVDADRVLRDQIVARNKIRARALGSVQASYDKVCG